MNLFWHFKEGVTSYDVEQSCVFIEKVEIIKGELTDCNLLFTSVINDVIEGQPFSPMIFNNKKKPIDKKAFIINEKLKIEGNNIAIRPTLPITPLVEFRVYYHYC